MNAPPTFESFLLFEGEKKITKEQDTKVKITYLRMSRYVLVHVYKSSCHTYWHFSRIGPVGPLKLFRGPKNEPSLIFFRFF